MVEGRWGNNFSGDFPVLCGGQTKGSFENARENTPVVRHLKKLSYYWCKFGKTFSKTANIVDFFAECELSHLGKTAVDLTENCLTNSYDFPNDFLFHYQKREEGNSKR